MKKLLWIVPAVLVLLLVVLFLSRNVIARVSVEYGAKKVTGFPLKIGSVDVGLFSGKVDVRDLKQQIRESEVLVYAVGIDGEGEPTMRRGPVQPVRPGRQPALPLRQRRRGGYQRGRTRSRRAADDGPPLPWHGRR